MEVIRIKFNKSNDNKNLNNLLKTPLRIKDFLIVVGISVSIFTLILIIILLNTNYIFMTDIPFIILFLILPFIPAFIGYFLLNNKIKIGSEILKKSETMIPPEELKKLAKKDLIGALYIFVNNFHEINTSNIIMFQNIFNNFKFISKLRKLADFFNRESIYEKEVIALLLARNIKFAIETCINYDLSHYIDQIINSNIDIPKQVFKSLFEYSVEKKRLNIITKLIDLNRINPDEYFEILKILFKNYIQAPNAFDTNKLMLLKQKLEDCLLEFKISPTIEIYQEFIDILERIFTKLFKLIEQKQINLEKLFDILYTMIQFNRDYMSFYKYLFTDQLLNYLYRLDPKKFLNYYKILKFIIVLGSSNKILLSKYIMAFSKFESEIVESIFSEINNKLKMTHSQCLNDAMLYSEEHSKLVFKIYDEYFEYSTPEIFFSFFTLFINSLKDSVKRDETSTSEIYNDRKFYLKTALDYWTDISIKLISGSININYRANWNENLKNQYFLFLIKHISILRCTILRILVEFKIIDRDKYRYRS
ncbi:MAG: hypothetical protein ACTSPQ_09435 [Candidatus Helarchaeota archaeon]